MLLTRDQILTADDRPTETVPVPEWGGEVRIITMSAAERTRYEAWLLTAKANHFARARALLTSLTAVDDAGQLLFTEADIEALDRKSGAAIDRVFEASMALNKLRKKDIEDLEKNSGTGPSAGSCSDSPSNSAAPSESS